MPAPAKILPLERVERLVHLVRGQKVMLDYDLAALYGVEARALNQAVKRNRNRFPDDFMFQLAQDEIEFLTQSRASAGPATNSSQFVISSLKHRGSKYRYYAFTEQGIAMLSSVLRSPQAVRVNIEIMRAFVRMRQWLASSAELTQKLDNLEKKFDGQFKVVFEAIRELTEERTADQPRREIGFHTGRGGAKSRGKVRIKNFRARTGHKL
jgi:hypothetical protein